MLASAIGLLRFMPISLNASGQGKGSFSGASFSKNCNKRSLVCGLRNVKSPATKITMIFAFAHIVVQVRSMNNPFVPLAMRLQLFSMPFLQHVHENFLCRLCTDSAQSMKNHSKSVWDAMSCKYRDFFSWSHWRMCCCFKYYFNQNP